MSSLQPCPVCGQKSWANEQCRVCEVPDGHLRAEEILSIARISYRQLDYWLRSNTAILQHKNPGTGRVRHFSYVEALQILAVADLVHQGVQASAAGKLVRQALNIGQQTITITTDLRRLRDDHLPVQSGFWDQQAPPV